MTESVSIPVRTALMPLFYKDFRCLAGAWYNCCGGWEVAFNKKEYLRLKRSVKSGEMEEILSNGMSRLRKHELGDDFYARFTVGAGGVCPFQSEDGLCRLQLECGEAVLPEVCREYPRKAIYTAAAKEMSLSPSCEAVLAMLWDLPQGLDFWEEPLPKQEWRTMQTPPRLARFADIRSFCIDVLQERSLRLSRRVLLLGVLIQRLAEFDWTAEGVVDEWLAWGREQLRSPTTASILEGMPRDRLKFSICNIRMLLELYEGAAAKKKEIYRSLITALSADREGWEKKGVENFSMDITHYGELEEHLEELLGHTDEFFENLMVMTAFYKTFPNPAGPAELWRSYAAICGIYSFYWFAAVLGCHKEVSRERLFQVIVAVSRDLLHNKGRLDMLADEVLESGGTLEHMAILSGG